MARSSLAGLRSRRFPTSTLRRAILIATLGAVASIAHAADAVLVLPFRAVGVSDTTLLVVHDILESELRGLGLPTLPARSMPVALPAGEAACDDPGCAAVLAAQCQAGRVVYGSLSRLGRKILVRLTALRVGESTPGFTDQLTASTEEDLDTVMRRFAGAIAAGQPDAGRATVESVLDDEAREPRLRASRSGLGFRAGFLFPAGKSYTGADRMTNLHFVYKYERPTFLIETTTALGLTFGEGNVEWTILDLAAARVFQQRDFSAYLGAGVGVHSVRLQRDEPHTVDGYGGTSHTYMETSEESATAPSLDLVTGMLGMRTFDFEIIVELRYHHVFEDFGKVGANGAHGFLLTIGTSR
jgi:hypothetical protein